MKIEQLFFPVTMVAAIGSIWLLFRKGATDTVTQMPNPASSGVTLPGGGVQPVHFDVPAIPANLHPAIYLKDPYAAFPGSGDDQKMPPGYLTFNFGPPRDGTKQPSPSPDSCGCGGSCKTQDACSKCSGGNQYGDGNGEQKMNTNRAAQLAESQPDKWLNNLLRNTAGYAQLESVNTDTPSLTSLKPGALLDGPRGVRVPNSGLDPFIVPAEQSSGFAYIN